MRFRLLLRLVHVRERGSLVAVHVQFIGGQNAVRRERVFPQQMRCERGIHTFRECRVPFQRTFAKEYIRRDVFLVILGDVFHQAFQPFAGGDRLGLVVRVEIIHQPIGRKDDKVDIILRQLRQTEI